MEDALYKYLDMKVHHIIKNNQFSRIEIVPKFNRKSIIHKQEKIDKLFNWKRPTAKIKGDKLIIECFPGSDYIIHYTLIKLFYHLINNLKIPEITIRLPSTEEKRKTLLKTNIRNIPVSDFVILGYVQRLLSKMLIGKEMEISNGVKRRWMTKKSQF